ncbi:hypothetical protein HPB48_008453 [Haemaphysalis longicornis]|uniref:Uncharacterized protein n=1 Tax=Haemaphysalis longicornis TaxID=44386 RepID=A0A9J6GPU3_HAELO|nr:hypothetical protein HPB48_008453 [Haemaphysalis longicornis]
MPFLSKYGLNSQSYSVVFDIRFLYSTPLSCGRQYVECTIPYKIGRDSEKASSFQHSHGMGRKRKLHANYAKHYPDFEATSSNDLVVCNLCRVQVSTANEIGALGIADPES